MCLYVIDLHDHAGEYGRVQIRTGIEMRGMSRRPIIGICHGMEFISDVPALSIRDGILDISGPRGGSVDRLICRIELGDVYGPDIVPAPDCEMRVKHLR